MFRYLTRAASHHVYHGGEEVLVRVEVAVVECARGVEALAPVQGMFIIYLSTNYLIIYLSMPEGHAALSSAQTELA